MKKVLLLMMVMWSAFSYAQQERILLAEADLPSDCACLPGYSVCKAESVFMSCCMCCEPGSSCGAWTAFGLVGCRCEKTATTGTAKIWFYPNKFDAFLSFLDKYRIDRGELSALVEKTLEGTTLYEVRDNPAKTYVAFTVEQSKTFSEAYLAILKPLLEREDQKELIENYINQNQ
jgi:hypothetical protein